MTAPNLDRAVRDRYSAASQEFEPGLCCPVDYDPQYLRVIPQDVLERDYGCGDPVSHVRPGERVLDLGSGAGKVCFIAAQIVGATGSVIGIDINEDMLALARSARATVAAALGYGNVEFVKGRIEDLALDLEFLDRHLARHPVASNTALDDLAELADRMRRDSPLIPDASVDVVISNCVLNLVATQRKRTMFTELARVLRPGGRAVISDIVADLDVPQAMRADPQLWSGCYSGAMREEEFLDAFLQAGLTGLRVLKREDRPWETVGEVTFRSVTVEAHKPAAPPPVDGTIAATYLGPFALARIDTGLDLPRGLPVRLGTADLAAVLTGAYRDQVKLTDAAGLGPPATVACGPAGCC
jgi:arsenite methyltransferase